MAENKKKSVLQEAEELIHGARQKTYNHPYIDFGRVAKMLSGLLKEKLKEGVEIEIEEVPLIMVCIKLSRLMAIPGHRDSMVDGPGYFGTYEMVMDRKAEIAARELKIELNAAGYGDVDSLFDKLLGDKQYQEGEAVELSKHIVEEAAGPERQYQPPAPTVYNNALIVDQEGALAEEIQKRLERERYHQNLRAMSVNPEAVHDDYDKPSGNEAEGFKTTE